jgi:tRNA threonylcarbamoyladenosine biosynthesis protein TsaB
MHLLVESATRVCSVALSHQGQIVAWRTEDQDGYTHAERLHVLVQQVLDEVGCAFNQLSAIGVSMGPGSYTGLRIGLSAAKGWCYALQIPLIGIDTLHAMATGFMVENPEASGLICPMIDARRMEVYMAFFENTGARQCPDAALVLQPESFHRELHQGPVHFMGDGSPKFQELCTHVNAHFHDLLPDARWMARPVEQAYSAGRFLNLAYAEPLYLKEANVTVQKKGIN